MLHERWFPQKYELSGGRTLGRLRYAGTDWQVYRVDAKNTVLVVKPSLAGRWVDSELLPDAVFEDLTLGRQRFKAVFSGPDRRLEPIDGGGSPDSKADGLSFALSLRETRKVERAAPLHDAIYVERYSRLLPTWTVSEECTDQEVLGRWLTGGVTVPATSLRRLASLLGWLEKQDVHELVEAAGFATSSRTGATLTREEDGVSVSASEPNSAFLSEEAAEQARGFGRNERFQLSGRPALEAFFIEHVIDIVENAEQYKALGIDFPSAIVLHGPPGCGKTFAVERLVEYLDWPIFHIESNSVGSPYIHETSRKVSELFEKAMDAAPSVIVIDEMESYLSDRQIHQSTGLHHVEEVAEFLRRIPEATQRRVLVVGMTNRIEMIDSAILRRGRFDHIVEVSMPSASEVSELIDSLLAKLPVHGVIDREVVVEALTGRALSDTAFVVREAARLAVRAGKSALDEESLKSALASLPPIVGKARRIGFTQD